MSQSLTCFKAYDIRGQLGEELNIDIAYRVGRAYGEFCNLKALSSGRHPFDQRGTETRVGGRAARCRG